jgi:single-stranded-DNA-specific exonuclease
LPKTAAIVHPGLPDSTYSFAGLCGAGVALKLAWALCQQASQAKRVTEAMRTFLMRAVGLAAIGTVADVVPLVDENRILVRHGLNCLRHYPTPGLLALEQITGLNQKPQLDCEDVAFTLAPRLNAAGRLGQAPLALELLITESSERARKLAEFIHSLNDQRQSLERSVYRAAHREVRQICEGNSQTAALVLAGRGWHPGVIGIVAGRLAEEYHRPVVLISLDELGTKPAMGSGRSIAGFDLHEALAACDRHLLGHGGHEAAAGLTIHEGQVEAFRADFCTYAQRMISPEDCAAELLVDAETPLSALTHQTVRQIESLAPFGHGNHRPVLCTTDVRLAEPPKRIGSAGRHLALRVEQHGISLRGVAFGGGDWEQELGNSSGPLAVAFKPVINHFRGRSTVEMHLADWRCDGA